MSKRFWLPTRKGTEIQPQTFQQPTKLVIKGVPDGTPLHDAVLQKFGGQLKQFHGKAQQDYSLSSNPIGHRHVEWTGARATYDNQYGQETLVLQVDDQVLSELSQRSSSPWDWAIVNFKVIDPPSAAKFAAYMIAPLLEHLAPGMTEAKGVTYTPGGDSGIGTKPISFPNPDNFIELAPLTVDPGYTAGSLSVDLKVAHPEAEVLIDVYGKIEGARMCARQNVSLPAVWTIPFPANAPTIPAPSLDTVPWFIRGNLFFRLPDCSSVQTKFYLGSITSNFGSGFQLATMSATIAIADLDADTTIYATFAAVRSGTTLTITVSTDTPGVALYGDWDPDPHNIDPDAAAAGWTSGGWWQFTVAGKEGDNGWLTDTFSADGGIEITYSNPSESGPTPATDDELWSTAAAGYGTQLNYNISFIGSLYRTPAPTDADAEILQRDMIVAGIVGKGDPDWVYSTHTSDYAFNAWEGKSLYPTPIGTSIVNEHASIGSTLQPDAALIDHYGLPYLGRLVINRKLGFIGFKSAA